VTRMTLLGLFDFIFLSEQKNEIDWRILYIRFLKKQCALNVNLTGHQVPFNTLGTNLNWILWSYCCCGHRHKKFGNTNFWYENGHKKPP
jgi:hypothetical protein